MLSQSAKWNSSFRSQFRSRHCEYVSHRSQLAHERLFVNASNPSDVSIGINKKYQTIVTLPAKIMRSNTIRSWQSKCEIEQRITKMTNSHSTVVPIITQLAQIYFIWTRPQIMVQQCWNKTRNVPAQQHQANSYQIIR